MNRKAEKFLEAAQEAMGKRNYSKAIKAYNSYMELEPDDKKALYTLADAYVFEGDLKKGIDLYLEVANHLKVKGFTMKAIAVCKRIINIDQANVRARNLMNELYQDKSSEQSASQVIYTQTTKMEKPEVTKTDEMKKLDAEEEERLKIGDEISVSGMQAVSAESSVTDSSQDMAYKETVVRPKVTTSSFETPVAKPATEEPVKVEKPSSLTGGFFAIDPFTGQDTSGIVDEIERDLVSFSADDILADDSITSSSQMDFKHIESAIEKERGPVQQKPARTPTMEMRILSAKDLLFDQLDKDEYLKLIEQMDVHVFREGDVIVNEGAAGDSMFIICSGEVRVLTRDRKGDSIQLAELGEGDFFGEVSLLTGKPRTATIISKTDTELLELKRTSLPEIENHCPNLRQKLEDFYHKRTMHTIETLLGD